MYCFVMYHLIVTCVVLLPKTNFLWDIKVYLILSHPKCPFFQTSKIHLSQLASLIAKLCFRDLIVHQYIPVNFPSFLMLSSSLLYSPACSSDHCWESRRKTFSPAEIQHFQPNYSCNADSHSLKHAVFPCQQSTGDKKKTSEVRFQNK